MSLDINLTGIEKTSNKKTTLTDNSDTFYPSQKAVKTAVDAKENTITAGTTAQYFRGDKTFQTLDKTAVGLSNVDNTSDANKPVSTATQTALNNKVDAVAGKGLSANDFTNTLKTKLDGIQDGAEVNVNADWNATSGDAQILNKPTIPSVTGLVPYTGATQNVDLGEYELKAGQIEFDQTPTGTAGVAVMRWNDTDGTIDLGLKGGNVTLQLGQEQLVRVVNKTATNINLLEANYQAVRVTGAQGQRLKVDLAQATNDVLSAETIGLVTETINNNQEGFITTSGLVRGINTTGSLQGETWADGDVVYLSATTAGRITNVKPSAPNHLVIIGYVVSAHATQGSIFVKVDNGYKLDELHNVAISTPLNNQSLVYETASTLWKNKALTTADIADSSNKRYQTDNQQLFNDATSSIQTQLDAKQSKLLAKKLGASATIATTVESIIGNVEILGGTLASTDYLNIRSRARKTGTIGTYLLRYYLNTTSNSLTGATQIAISGTQTTSSIISTSFERDFTIDGGNLIGFPFATASNDGTASASTVSSVAYTVATTYYIITTITLASALDTASLIGQKITNF
jgi:hypothetical protein